MSVVRIQPEDPMSFSTVSWGRRQGKLVCVKGLLWIWLVTQVLVSVRGYKEQGRQHFSTDLEPCCRGFALVDGGGGMNSPVAVRATVAGSLLEAQPTEYCIVEPSLKSIHLFCPGLISHCVLAHGSTSL